MQEKIRTVYYPNTPAGKKAYAKLAKAEGYDPDETESVWNENARDCEKATQYLSGLVAAYKNGPAELARKAIAYGDAARRMATEEALTRAIYTFGEGEAIMVRLKL